MSRFLDNLNLWLLLLILGAVALPFLVIGLSFVAILATCCWEKQRVRDFTPATPDLLPPPSPYFQAMSDAARELGFQHGGLFGQDRNSSTYRCCLSLWLSADQKSLLCIGGGKLARMNYKKTMLISRLASEKSLVTMDTFGSEDLSGTGDVGVLMRADLRELNEFHLQRLARAGVEPRPFSADKLLVEFEEWKRLRADRLVAQGLAKYLSSDCNTWRFTPRGAWLYAVAGYFRGLQKAKAQKERAHRNRPGD